MVIELFTIPGCSYCIKAKELFARAKVDYIQTVVGTDISKEEFKKLHPYSTVTGFPVVVIDGKPIGGLVDTVKYFVDNGLVKSSKKG